MILKVFSDLDECIILRFCSSKSEPDYLIVLHKMEIYLTSQEESMKSKFSSFSGNGDTWLEI